MWSNILTETPASEVFLHMIVLGEYVDGVTRVREVFLHVFMLGNILTV